MPVVSVDFDPWAAGAPVPVDYDPFSAKPVDYDPFAPPTNAYEQALQQYPILRDQGVVGGPGQHSQRLEFWPPYEPGPPDRPRPDFIPFDKPGVELGTGDVRPIDVLGDVVSHHMVNKDPVIKRYYERFAESLNDDQKQRLQEQYQFAQQNENETRPYDQWEEKSGLPAYFRGYAFQQWPDEFNQQAYTPEQRGHFDRMMNYLQGPQESPTPTPY
jgi:hypothetical protein